MTFSTTIAYSHTLMKNEKRQKQRIDNNIMNEKIRPTKK